MKTNNVIALILGISVGFTIGMYYNSLYKELQYHKKTYDSLVYQKEWIKTFSCEIDEELVYFVRNKLSVDIGKHLVFTSERPSNVTTYGVGCRDKTTKIIRQEGALINFLK